MKAILITACGCMRAVDVLCGARTLHIAIDKNTALVPFETTIRDRVFAFAGYAGDGYVPVYRERVE